MEIGAVTEAVEVSAEAVQLQTESGEVSNLIGAAQTQAMPLNGRVFSQLVDLVPGVVSESGRVGGGTGLSSDTNVSINGSQSNSNLWLIDGQNNMDIGSNAGNVVTPPLDALEEFKVLRNNFSAEFGQVTGGVINVVTKSGTRNFHGSVYEFFRNDKLDAADFFSVYVLTQFLPEDSRTYGLATQAAFTFVGNNTGSSATPTAVDIAALTSKASPAATDLVIISDQAASGAWKRATVSSIASAGSVSSIAGNTGAFTLSHGLTNSTNDLRIDATLFKGALFGCILSTAGSSATFSSTAGSCVDSTGADFMALAAISKTTSAWAVGSGNGGLDTGAVANSTWYHAHVIKRTDTNVVDLLFSLSATAPTMPTNYTLFRRIGSMKTNGSAQWTLFQQSGDTFLWDVPIQDVAATNPGTAAVTRTLTVPTGVVVEAISGVADQAVSSNHFVLLSPLSLTDQTPSSSIFSYSAQAAGTGITSFTAGGQFRTLTNTSAQIRTRASTSGASDVFTVSTVGWIDSRGRKS